MPHTLVPFRRLLMCAGKVCVCDEFVEKQGESLVRKQTLQARGEPAINVLIGHRSAISGIKDCVLAGGAVVAPTADQPVRGQPYFANMPKVQVRISARWRGGIGRAMSRPAHLRTAFPNN